MQTSAAGHASHEPELAEHLLQFRRELEGTGWQASVTGAWTDCVCLRLEQRRSTGSVPHTVEFCRRTRAEATRSARKNLRPSA
jgi:hypothetical protein